MTEEVSSFVRAQEWVGLVGGGLALVVAVIQGSRWVMSNRLWPNREKWSAECKPAEPKEVHYGDERLEPRRAFDKRSGGRWSQMREMRPKDYFWVNFGKARIVESIRFLDNGDGYPGQYKLLINDPSGKKHWTEEGIYNGPINIKFSKPKKIEGFSIEIMIPKMTPKDDKGRSPAWSIIDIKITEVRLFGHWWKKVIPE